MTSLADPARVLGRLLAGDRAGRDQGVLPRHPSPRSRSPTAATTCARSPPSPTSTSCSRPSVWAGSASAPRAGRRAGDSRREPRRSSHSIFVAVAAFAAVYAVASVIFFGIFGGFLTYPLLALVGNLRMLSSSVAAHLTPRVILTLVGLPLAYAVLVEATVRLVPPRSNLAPAPGNRVRPARRVADSRALRILHRLDDAAGPAHRRESALGAHLVVVAGDQRRRDRAPDRSNSPPTISRISIRSDRDPAARCLGRRDRAPNVIVVVLESVAARWAGLNGGPYDSTPVLKAESAHALVADNFYAHIGRSSNSLVAILLSAYPKLGFRDVTEEYPQLPGTSLASVFRDRGYRTAFVTPSDLSWAAWGPFLEGRGFGELRDHPPARVSAPISSWGVEDRCMVDGMIDFITQAPDRPFFVMGWTTQTHHPYEPTPGVPLLEMPARTGAGSVRARSLSQRPARDRPPSRTALRHRSPPPPRSGHAHRGPRAITGRRSAIRTTPTSRGGRCTRKTCTCR